MSHAITDKELKQLIKARRYFIRGWAIIDAIVYQKYIKLAKKKNVRQIRT